MISLIMSEGAVYYKIFRSRSEAQPQTASINKTGLKLLFILNMSQLSPQSKLSTLTLSSQRQFFSKDIFQFGDHFKLTQVEFFFTKLMYTFALTILFKLGWYIFTARNQPIKINLLK